MVDMALLDTLRHGAKVTSADGKHVGDLHAVVVDPRDEEVTHIVVNAGPHFPAPGFGAPNLVSVPIEEMADAQEGNVILKCTRQKFREMPSYVERQFGPPPEGWRQARTAGSGNVLWDVGVAVGASLSSIGGIAVPRETFRKASFERHILNDAPVWRQEPHEKMGEVERVLVDEDTDEISALVVRRGELFAHEVILPIEHVTEILDGVIRVRISDEEIEGLEPYQEG